MRLLGRDVPIPRLVLGALATVLVVALAVGVATTGASFAPFNPGWQGASELRSTADAAGTEPIVATEIDRYESVDATETVAVALAPEPRSAEQQAAMRSFAEAGGRLVIATRSPTAGNELLAGMDVDVRVAGPTLRDDVEHLHGPAFPTATPTANHSAVRNTSGLALNYGTALSVGEGAQALANSSAFSYLDVDASGSPGSGERLAARPVVAGQQVGDGEVIVVTDPSVFINAMLEHEPNRQFARNLVEDRDQMLLDRTDDGVPPLRAALLWLRGQPLAPALLGVVLVGLVVAWQRGWTGRARGYLEDVRRAGPATAAVGNGDAEATNRDGAGRPSQPPVDGAALDAYLADRYPEWDPERRRRVLGGVITDEQEENDDATVD